MWIVMFVKAMSYTKKIEWPKKKKRNYQKKKKNFQKNKAPVKNVKDLLNSN